jgi:hypothetical protein
MHSRNKARVISPACVVHLHILPQAHVEFLSDEAKHAGSRDAKGRRVKRPIVHRLVAIGDEAVVARSRVRSIVPAASVAAVAAVAAAVAAGALHSARWLLVAQHSEEALKVTRAACNDRGAASLAAYGGECECGCDGERHVREGCCRDGEGESG